MPPKSEKRPLSSPENTVQGRTKIMAGANKEGEIVSLKAIEALLSAQTRNINANMEDKIEGLKKTMEARFSELEKKIGNVERDNLELKKRNAELENRMSDLEKGKGEEANSGRLLQLERLVRQKNIVATGIDFESPQQGYDKLNKLIGAATKEEIKVAGLRAFKSKSGQGMIVAECGSIEEKLCIMRAKKLFVATEGDTSRPVYVDNDLALEDRITQSKLRGIAKELRAQGKEVRLSMGKLKVDGEWRSLNSLNSDSKAPTFRKEN